MDAVGASSISVTFTGSVHPHQAALSTACWQLTTASFLWRAVLHQIGTALLEPLGASHYQWLNYTEYNCLGPLSQVVTNTGVQSMTSSAPPPTLSHSFPCPESPLSIKPVHMIPLCTWLQAWLLGKLTRTWNVKNNSTGAEIKYHF